MPQIRPLIALAALILLGAATATHPVDGPDVDARFSLEPGRLHASLTFNLAYVDAVIPMFREDEEVVDPIAELPALEGALFDFVRTKVHVKADGVEIEPRLLSSQLDPGDPATSALFPLIGIKGVIKLSFSLEYPLAGTPDRLSIHWESYPPNPVLETLEGVPGVEINALFIAEGSDRDVVFHEGEPEFTYHTKKTTVAESLAPVPLVAPGPRPRWPLSPLFGLVGAVALGLLTRSRKVSLCALPVLGLAAALTLDRWSIASPLARELALPDDAQAQAIFRPLHRNVYGAFAYTDDAQVWDALSHSVSGQLLSSLHAEISQGLVLQDEGGAVARVRDVRHLETEVLSVGLTGEQPGFTVRARWQVEGAVFHWGHAHERTNEYVGRYGCIQTADGWRIATSELLSSEVVATTPRGEEDAPR